MFSHAAVLGTVLTLGFVSQAAHAQSVPPDFPLPVTATGYGSAVAVADGEVFVAEPLNLSTEGVVYVYRKDASGSWTETAQLRAADGHSGDRFGRAIVARDGVLLVGATSIDDSRGAAFVFTRDDDGHWAQAAKLTAADGETGDALGRSAALMDGFAVVGAAGHNESAGAVYVFRHVDDAWRQVAKLEAADAAADDLFGLTLAAGRGHVAVSAIQHNDRRGAVYVFRYDEDSDTWTPEAKLESADLPARANFGLALAATGAQVFVGAPSLDRNHGAVFHYAYDAGTGIWTEQERLLSPDTTRLQRFGATIHARPDRLWIAAPLADGFKGVLHAFTDEDGRWTPAGTVSGIDVARGDRFGGAVAGGEEIAAVGMAGDDYGEGTAVIFERRAGGGWEPVAKVFSEVVGLEAIAGGQVDCADGEVRGFGCQAVDVVSFLPREAIGARRGVRLNDVWGWTDPETGTEYAIVGRLDAAVFIDLRDPANPVYLGELPKTEGSPGSTWRDIKVYRDHAFIVSDGAGAHGMQVFDLTQLRHVTNAPVVFTVTAHYDGINSAHNIVINQETGYAFAVGSSGGGETCGGGLHMINIQNPADPTFAGCFAHAETGRRGTGYTHDAQCVTYGGPDAEHAGKEICFGANETALSIADVSDKDRPVALASATYPNVGYTHQGWLSADQRYFFSNDELDELNDLVPQTRTLIWDVSDLDDPVLVKEHFHQTQSTDHNLYVSGRYMYQTNNTAGLRILDVSDPETPVLVGFFDPVPHGDDIPGFDGTWSSYPFFGSGLIVVSSRREGVFVLKRRDVRPIP